MNWVTWKSRVQKRFLGNLVKTEGSASLKPSETKGFPKLMKVSPPAYADVGQSGTPADLRLARLGQVPNEVRTSVSERFPGSNPGVGV